MSIFTKFLQAQNSSNQSLFKPRHARKPKIANIFIQDSKNEASAGHIPTPSPLKQHYKSLHSFIPLWFFKARCYLKIIKDDSKHSHIYLKALLIFSFLQLEKRNNLYGIWLTSGQLVE
jgi:hypothetical protein